MSILYRQNQKCDAFFLIREFSEPGRRVLTMDYPKLIVNHSKDEKNDKLKRLTNYLDEIKSRRFTGYIKVNFSQGNIGRVEKFEEILKNT